MINLLHELGRGLFHGHIVVLNALHVSEDCLGVRGIGWRVFCALADQFGILDALCPVLFERVAPHQFEVEGLMRLLVVVVQQFGELFDGVVNAATDLFQLSLTAQIGETLNRKK